MLGDVINVKIDINKPTTFKNPFLLQLNDMKVNYCEINIELNRDMVERVCKKLGISYIEGDVLGVPTYTIVYEGNLIGRGHGNHHKKTKFTFYNPMGLARILREMGIAEIEARVHTDLKINSTAELEFLFG